MTNAHDVNISELVQTWLKHATTCTQMNSDGFDSIDVNEITGQSGLNNASVLDLSYRLFNELLRQYIDIADNYSAELIVSLDDTRTLSVHTHAELSTNRLMLRQPPELYLVKHSSEILQFNEEYRKVFQQTNVRSNQGLLLASYHSVFIEDSYSNFYRFKHYSEKMINITDSGIYIKYARG